MKIQRGEASTNVELGETSPPTSSCAVLRSQTESLHSAQGLLFVLAHFLTEKLRPSPLS